MRIIKIWLILYHINNATKQDNLMFDYYFILGITMSYSWCKKDQFKCIIILFQGSIENCTSYSQVKGKIRFLNSISRLVPSIVWAKFTQSHGRDIEWTFLIFNTSLYNPKNWKKSTCGPDHLATTTSSSPTIFVIHSTINDPSHKPLNNQWSKPQAMIQATNDHINGAHNGKYM